MTPRHRIWSPALLPNVLTSLNVLAGFYAITHILSGDFGNACWAIIIAGILDALDGMAARLSRSCSAFGIEFDSLADLVSFGMAPSLLAYVWILKPYEKVGWVASFLFLACGLLRLARFNVQSHDVQKHRFLGVPIPMAAGQIATTYLLLNHLAVPLKVAGIVVIVTAYLASFLMVSSIPYRSLKSISIKRRYAFYIPVLFLLMTAIIWIYPHLILWVLSSLYLLSGPAELLGTRTLGPALATFRRHSAGQKRSHLKTKTGKEDHG